MLKFLAAVFAEKQILTKAFVVIEFSAKAALHLPA
jgi:hypothetical protein